MLIHIQSDIVDVYAQTHMDIEEALVWIMGYVRPELARLIQTADGTDDTDGTPYEVPAAIADDIRRRFPNTQTYNRIANSLLFTAFLLGGGE